MLKIPNNIFSGIFGGPNADKPAHISDINKLIDKINVMNQNAPTSFFYTAVDGGGDGVTFSMTAMGSACVCADCGSANNCSGCPPANTSSFYKCASSGITFTNSATGVYRITLAPNITYTDTALRIENLVDGTATISMTKTSATQYDITVKDSARNPVAGKLAGSLVEVLIFN